MEETRKLLDNSNKFYFEILPNATFHQKKAYLELLKVFLFVT